jgi:hypothetical protein
VLKDGRVGHAEGTKQEGERNEEHWKRDNAAQAWVDGDVHSRCIFGSIDEDRGKEGALGDKWGHSDRLEVLNKMVGVPLSITLQYKGETRKFDTPHAVRLIGIGIFNSRAVSSEILTIFEVKQLSCQESGRVGSCERD